MAPVPTPATDPAARPQPFAGYAFDLDGTLYLGDHALPGAVDVVGRLRAEGRGVVFVTNNPLHPKEHYASKLTGLGIPACPSDIVTATDATITYLAERHPGRRLLVISEPLVADTLAAAGWHLTGDPAEAEVVVVSFDRTFDYAKLNAAYRAVRLHGAALVATNPDPYCPTPDGGLPDCAAMLAAVEACSGARAEAVPGKPSPYMAAAALDRLGLPSDAAAMVGDRLATDMAMAAAAGMAGVLVLSGATTRADVEAARRDGRPVPTYVVAGVHELLPPAGD